MFPQPGHPRVTGWRLISPLTHSSSPRLSQVEIGSILLVIPSSLALCKDKATFCRYLMPNSSSHDFVLPTLPLTLLTVTDERKMRDDRAACSTRRLTKVVRPPFVFMSTVSLSSWGRRTAATASRRACVWVLRNNSLGNLIDTLRQPSSSDHQQRRSKRRQRDIRL